MSALPSVEGVDRLTAGDFFMWMLEFADPNQSADDDNDDDDMPDLYSSNGILGALWAKRTQPPKW